MNTNKPRDPVAAARAAGAAIVHVAVIIEQQGHVLLFAEGGDGFIEESWQPPTVFAFPGETHQDALRRGLPPSVGVTITAVNEYLGHHDHHLSRTELVRRLYFRVAIADHHAVCRRSPDRHMWCRIDELPANTEPPPHHLAKLIASSAPASGPEPPSAQPLRAHARGLYPAEAAVELLINHAVWLRRSAFTNNFLHPVHGGPPMAYIAWADAITALDNGQLPCSGGESRILKLASSIGNGTPIDLRDALTGLDQRNINLVIQAIYHANGRRP